MIDPVSASTIAATTTIEKLSEGMVQVSEFIEASEAALINESPILNTLNVIENFSLESLQAINSNFENTFPLNIHEYLKEIPEVLDIDKYMKEIPVGFKLDPSGEGIFIDNILQLIESAEKIPFDELKKNRPELSSYIERMNTKLGVHEGGIMNSLEFYRIGDAFIIKSNNPFFKNTHILVDGKNAYCNAGSMYGNVINVNDGRGNLNEFLNEPKLMPGMTYHVDGNFEFTTDDIGRVNKVLEHYKDGVLTYREDNRSSYSEITKLKGGLDGDDGGHIIANNIGGPSEAINNLPMDASFNRSGEWKQMENEIQALVGNKVETFVEKTISYEGSSFRPNAIKTSVKSVDYTNSWNFNLPK